MACVIMPQPLEYTLSIKHAHERKQVCSSRIRPLDLIEQNLPRRNHRVLLPDVFRLIIIQQISLVSLARKFKINRIQNTSSLARHGVRL